MQDKAKQSAYMKEWRARKLAEDPDYENRRHAEWRRKNSERLKGYRAARLARDPDYERRYLREYRKSAEMRERERERAKERYVKLGPKAYKAYLSKPEQQPKEAARQQLRREVKKGRIIKPTACEDCGRVLPKARIQAHHEDYSKPFDVRWVCSLCHGKRHEKAA